MVHRVMYSAIKSLWCSKCTLFIDKVRYILWIIHFMVLFCTGNEEGGIIEQACNTRKINATACVRITCHRFCTDFQTLFRLRPKSCTYHQYRHNTGNGNVVKVHDFIANSDTRIPPSNPARGRDIGCSLFFKSIIGYRHRSWNGAFSRPMKSAMYNSGYC